MICVKFNQEFLNKRYWLEFEYLSYDALTQLTVSFPPFHLQTHRSGQSPWLDKPWERRFRVAWIHYYICIMHTCVDMYTKISNFKLFFSDMYSIARSAYLVKKLSKKDFLGMVYYISFGGRGKKSFQCNLSQFLRQSSILSYFLFVNYKYASSWY